MDQDLQEHEEESTRDLRLSRWRVPALAAVLIVNLCLVTLAVGRPVAPSEHRIPVAAVAHTPATAIALPQVDSPPAATDPEPSVAPVEPAPVDPVPVERVVIAPDIDLVLPPEPASVEQPAIEPTTVSPPQTQQPQPDPPTTIEPAPVEPAPIEPTPADPPMLPRNELPALIIVNPPQSGGPVHFAIDGEVFSLLPGEYHRLPVSQLRRIEYHRGDDFDYAQHELTEGVYQFTVSETGWTLLLVEREKADRLIETCRAIAK